MHDLTYSIVLSSEMDLLRSSSVADFLWSVKRARPLHPCDEVAS